MSKILILGSTGMLGSAITRIFSQSSHELIEVNRSGKVTNAANQVLQFDVENDPFEKILSFKFDYVINCIGLIRQKINVNSSSDILRAINLNAEFPIKLINEAENHHYKILQIATDCVYSGFKGNYSESDHKDPIDVYGYSKALGEVESPSLSLIRTSIIGREVGSAKSLVEWVLSQPNEAKLKGFTNHVWNGVTTFHLAKIFLGMVDNKSFVSGTSHLIPKNDVSKYELIEEIAHTFGRDDLKIEKNQAETSTDRTLRTIDASRNLKFWQNAGYSSPLSVNEMLVEYGEWLKIQ